GDAFELLASHLEGRRIAVDGNRCVESAIAVAVDDHLGLPHGLLLSARERKPRCRAALAWLSYREWSFPDYGDRRDLTGETGMSRPYDATLKDLRAIKNFL